MSRMLEDYDHLLNIDYDKNYRIGLTGWEGLITTAGRKTEKLDGIWNFSPDVYDTYIRKKFFEELYVDEQGRDKPVDCNFDQWEKVMVPSNWNIQKDQYWFFEGSGVYTRTFQYFNRGEERTFIKVGAANYEARIWLNGELIARHEGGFTPFMVEVTGKLKESNRIILGVNNERKLNQIPSINFDWFNYGGISRSVELVRVPMAYIQDAFVRLVPKSNGEKICVTVKTKYMKSGDSVTIRIPKLQVEETAYLDECGNAEVVIAAQPVLWNCDDPVLYQVIVQAGEDIVEDLVGFREISVDGKRLFLNGKELFLKGVSCHEESMVNGRAMKEDEQIAMIATAKELGCNVIRLSHYPHSDAVARLADRMGIMLWEEIPVYWALCFNEPQTYQNAENQLSEMIIRDRNRASVILWGVGNENPDTDERLRFMKQLSARCKELDETRLTVAACLVDIDEMRVKDRLCEWIDVVAINEYYGWYYRDYEGLREILQNTKLEKPLVISETGADAVKGHFGDEEELFTENHQAKMYQKQFQISDGKIQGIFPWILYDFRSPIRLNPLQGSFNRKGLIAEDKTYRKMAYDVVQNYYKQK